MAKNNIIKKEFDMLVVGVGGQGLLTLLKIISEAAILEGKEVKTSELHGLSQRGGSVQVHIRFGEEIHSPLIEKQKAELVLALEAQEALNGVYFAKKDTNFLVNEYFIPIPFQTAKTEEEIKKEIQKVAKTVIFIPAEKICKERLQNSLVSGVYLLGAAVWQSLIPLKQESLKEAIKKIIPSQFLDLNIKAFDLAKNA
jgi:indolepyruvate ferredoxin oxidoreductase, beta subunit